MKKILLFVLILISCYRNYSQILIPNIPNVNGDIQAFEFDTTTNKLYIIGEFTQVGAFTRNGFAVIDIPSGNVLSDFDTLTINRISPSHVSASMKIYKNKLYVGGIFTCNYNSNDQGYLFTIDLINGTVNSLYGICPLSDFKIYNDKIYTTGGYLNSGPVDQYMVTEMDTLGNISWQKSISTNFGDELLCVDARNGNLFIGGSFTTFGGNSLNNIAKVDINTHTILSWQPSPLPGISPNFSCFGVENMLVYPNDILLNLYSPSCGSPNSIMFYDVGTGNINNQNTSLPYQGNWPCTSMENDTSFWYANFSAGLKLHGIKNYASAWSPTAGGGNVDFFLRKGNYLFVAGNFSSLESSPQIGLGIYCFPPRPPIVQTAPATVCKSQSNVAFSVVVSPNISSYTWTYTGGMGATIIGSGSTVLVNFSVGATSGSLNVTATNSCGETSTALSIPVIVYPQPSTNAGADIHFTCTHTIGVLNGSPNNSVSHAHWTGPNSYSSTSATNVVNTANVTGGDYILTVTINLTGCSKSDTAVIYFDTLKPTINHLTGNYLLTCQTTSLTLNAAANYPLNDTLHWTGFTSSHNNPDTVYNIGTYILTITSGTNGCKNKDSVHVTSNTSAPNISISSLSDTLTCSKDSIKLQAQTTNTNTILYWKDSNNDSLLNNFYINQTGVYSAFAIDTLNGCSSQNVMSVTSYTTPPVIQQTKNIYQINCSYNTVVLNDTSLTPGTLVQWSGPGNFVGDNPAITNQQGVYVFTSTNLQNGCTAKDSVTVLLQPVLILNISNDTTICNGTSVTFSASPIGGTPNFTYTWNNSAGNFSTASTSPVDTTLYIVTVTDNAGCVGKDSVKINVPSVISDSVATFMPCDPNNPNGQIQIFGNGGVVPYQYSLNNGALQSSNIFSNLNFGTYTVSVKDALGCAYESTSAINNLSMQPAPDFILSTNEIKGDTFVVVDISNPRPDSVFWILPTGCQIINTNSFAPEIINSDTGAMQITMIAWFGTCEMMLTKNIEVLKYDTSFVNNYNNNGIKDVTLYPNPNTGNFTVDISLYKIQTFAVFIFDAAGNELMRLSYSNLNFVSAPITIPNPVPGTYLLKVIAEYDSQTKPFLITQ